MSFWKIGVSGGALVPYIIPVFFESFQLIGVGNVIRVFHIQRCKLNTESILVMWQCQELGIIDVGGQYAALFGCYRLLRLLQAGENDWGSISAGMD